MWDLSSPAFSKHEVLENGPLDHQESPNFFYFLNNFIYVFLAVLGLQLLCGPLSSCGVGASYCSSFSCCRAWALECSGFSSCGSWALEFSSCGSWA